MTSLNTRWDRCKIPAWKSASDVRSIKNGLNFNFITALNQHSCVTWTFKWAQILFVNNFSLSLFTSLSFEWVDGVFFKYIYILWCRECLNELIFVVSSGRACWCRKAPQSRLCSALGCLSMLIVSQHSSCTAPSICTSLDDESLSRAGDKEQDRHSEYRRRGARWNKDDSFGSLEEEL